MPATSLQQLQIQVNNSCCTYFAVACTVYRLSMPGTVPLYSHRHKLVALLPARKQCDWSQTGRSAVASGRYPFSVLPGSCQRLYVAVFWVMTQCSLVGSFRKFRGNMRPPSSTLFYFINCRGGYTVSEPQNQNLAFNHCKNLKFHIVISCFTSSLPC